MRGKLKSRTVEAMLPCHDGTNRSLKPSSIANTYGQGCVCTNKGSQVSAKAGRVSRVYVTCYRNTCSDTQTCGVRDELTAVDLSQYIYCVGMCEIVRDIASLLVNKIAPYAGKYFAQRTKRKQPKPQRNGAKITSVVTRTEHGHPGVRTCGDTFCYS